jgi:hypothetical protein
VHAVFDKSRSWSRYLVMYQFHDPCKMFLYRGGHPRAIVRCQAEDKVKI